MSIVVIGEGPDPRPTAPDVALGDLSAALMRFAHGGIADPEARIMLQFLRYATGTFSHRQLGDLVQVLTQVVMARGWMVGARQP